MHELEPTEIPEHDDYLREMRWLDPVNGRRGRGRGTRGRGGGRGRGRGGRGLRGIGGSLGADFMEESVGTFEKTTRKYTRRGGRARGRGRKRGRRSVRPRQRSEGRLTVPKAARFGSFADISINTTQNRFVDSPRSSPGNQWGLEETRTPYVEEEENSSGSQSEENGLGSGDEYDDQPDNYMIGYGQKKPMGLLDDDMEEEDEDDIDGYEEEDNGPPIGHHRQMMDADVDDEDEEEMGDDDDDDDGDDMMGGDVNGVDEEDYSSEYSD